MVLVGDAAHGLSPLMSAGGTPGVEDVGVLARDIAAHDSVPDALAAYEADRLPRYAAVRDPSLAVEQAADAVEYARSYASFSHWMPGTRPTGPWGAGPSVAAAG